MRGFLKGQTDINWKGGGREEDGGGWGGAREKREEEREMKEIGEKEDRGIEMGRRERGG